MNEIQVFNNPEFGAIRTVNINGEPWFVGKDVAQVLGYTDINHAILDHVDAEDRINSKTQGQNAPELGQRGTWLINESGLEQMAEEKRQFDQLHKKSSKSSRRSSGGGRDQLNQDTDETMDSILNLGAGPISPETLAEMVDSGQVSEGTSETGKPIFERKEGPPLPYTWQYL